MSELIHVCGKTYVNSDHIIKIKVVGDEMEICLTSGYATRLSRSECKNPDLLSLFDPEEI